jgi:hypothetical protein
MLQAPFRAHIPLHYAALGALAGSFSRLIGMQDYFRSLMIRNLWFFCNFTSCAVLKEPAMAPALPVAPCISAMAKQLPIFSHRFFYLMAEGLFLWFRACFRRSDCDGKRTSSNPDEQIDLRQAARMGFDEIVHHGRR